MGTHGHKGLAHITEGSVAEDVVNHLTEPVWTYVMQ
jgi:nucleotide-binding universal stress UspA family protein